MRGGIEYLVLLSLFWAPIDNINGVVLPTTNYQQDNGATWICLNRTEENECPYDKELAKCSRNNTLMECKPCRHGYRNCVRASSLRDVKCYRPELDCEPDEKSVVTELIDGGCHTRCVCIQEGFAKDGFGECVERHQCGINETLTGDRCSKCPEGSFKPWKGDGSCIAIPGLTNQHPRFTTTPRLGQTVSVLPVNETLNTKDPAEITVTAVQALSSTEVYVQWERPGTMYNYTVVYQPKPLDPSAKKTTSLFNKDPIVNITIQELMPATSYRAYIIASDTKKRIQSSNFDVTTPKSEGKGKGGTTHFDWSKAGTVIGIVTLLILSGFILMYVYRKCRRRRDTTRDMSDLPPPYEAVPYDPQPGMNDINVEALGGNSPPADEEQEIAIPPPSPPRSNTDDYGPQVPESELNSFSVAASHSPISNDPDETDLKRRHSGGSSSSNERVYIPSNSRERRMESDFSVLPIEPVSELPLVSDPFLPSTAANQVQSSIDLANQVASFQSRPSIRLGSPTQDPTSSQTYLKKKPEEYVGVSPSDKQW